MSNYNVIIPHYSVMLADGLVKIIQDRYMFKHQISMELLSSAMNDVYRVYSGEYRYIVRIPRHERFWPFSKKSFQFELELLNFLRKWEISVSYPIPTKERGYLGLLNAPEGIRYYAMYSEVKGVEPDTSDILHMRLAGEYIAKLHNTAQEFQSSNKCLLWKLELLLDYGVNKLKQALPEVFNDDFLWLQTRTTELVSEFLDLLPQWDDSNWGFIHGSYAPKNIRIQGENIASFDFEYTGQGYFILDLVNMLKRTSITNINNKYFRVFLDAYEQIRPLSDGEKEALPILAKLSLVSKLTESSGMRDLVGVLWFHRKFQEDIDLLRRVL